MATFKKAEPREAYVKLGLYGAAGSGKSLTSLLIAEGLLKGTGKRIAYVDTELGTEFYARSIPERSVHPEAFDIDRLDTKSLMETLEAVEKIDPAIHGAVVIDSITHLWEAAKESFRGRLTSKGGIPITAWGAIKRPYKRLMALLLDGAFHVIICGREGVAMAEDSDGEPQVVGHRMKAEGETAYEPHLTARMVPRRDGAGGFVISAQWEKDRSGILTGRTTDWPNYATIEPVVRHLSGAQRGALGTPEATADLDAEMQAERAEQEERERQALVETIRSAIKSAKTIEELKAAWLLTSGKKGKLGDAYEGLEEAKNIAKAEILASKGASV